MKVLHIISSLETGGAETMLYNLISTFDPRVESEVICLTNLGYFGQKLVKLGVPVRAVGLQRNFLNPAGLFRFFLALRQSRPDVIQTWMYHSDLIGGLTAVLSGGAPVVWGIRSANLDPRYNRSRTLFLARLNGLLSRFVPKLIISNSQAAKSIHTELGYEFSKFRVIPNGFDTVRFKPDPSIKIKVRLELDIPAEAMVVGLVGRFDPLKDHENFLKAAEILQSRMPDQQLFFVVCGFKIDWDNSALTQHIAAHRREFFRLLGNRDDIEKITAAFDIAVSSSCGEGFANSIGEAMACGVPCAVTDVGDSRMMVGDTGVIVPPENPALLADACLRLIAMTPEARQSLGIAARERILEAFSLKSVANQFASVYEEAIR